MISQGVPRVDVVERYTSGWSDASRLPVEGRAVNTRVQSVDRTTVEVPYRETPRPHLERWLPHWKYSEVVSVELADGTVGHGETMLYYTWGETTDAAVDRVTGRNAADFVWDESLGAGLQMALFDAVGRSLGVPVHSLLGEKVHDRTPHSWWAMDMPADDWLAECERAIDAGYTDIKVKARPWFDLRDVVATLSAELPQWFGIDLDFNETLLDADRGLSILKDLERHPQVETFESPIPQEDVEGNRRLREELDADIAMHYGRPPAKQAIESEVCDGFILNRSARETVDQGAVVSMADRPLWLQLVGTGLTTSFALHFGAVLDAATWPAITCHQMYEETLVEEAFAVENGEIPVPDDPGLGVTLDTDVVERYAVRKPDEQPTPDCLIETSWPDGRRMYFTDGYQMQRTAERGEFPYFEEGVSTRVVPYDGSDRWHRLHEQAESGPVTERQ
jgi:galactonate dehydratase